MWNVTNNSLRTILERYQAIIECFFQLVLEQSQIEGKRANLSNDEYLVALFDAHEILDSRLLNINKSATDRIKPLINEIIMLDRSILETEYNAYIAQNNQVNNGNYNLNQSDHPQSLIRIFKDYFYEKFFGIEWIWRDLVGREYTRTMFKDDFKKENKLNACPYCDIDTISTSRNSWIEHFLPKSKFPYLACNPNNMIPSCTACNVAGTGKGENVKNPIANLLNGQIGDNITFEYDGNSINISSNEDDSIENYIDLLNLRIKYNEKSVRDSILSVLKTNYNIILRSHDLGEFQQDVFFDFIYAIGKEKGFYFVQKDLLKDIDGLL